MANPKPLARFDWDNPDTIANPYPEYERLRRSGQVCRLGPFRYGVTRHEDVRALLRDRRLVKYDVPDAYYKAVTGNDTTTDFLTSLSALKTDPALRRLLVDTFSPQAVRALQGQIRDEVRCHVTRALERGRVDFVSDLARPLPVSALSSIIGVEPSARSTVFEQVTKLIPAGDASLSGSDLTSAGQALTWLRGYFEAQLQARVRTPRPDLTSRVAETATDPSARERGRDLLITMLYAGVDTSTNLISAACAGLLGAPDQFALLRGDPGLASSAVEEFLRFDAPIQLTSRLVPKRIEIGDHVVRRASVLILMLGSANHDPAVFDAPERLRIQRHPNPHLSFGGGSFFCIGAALARCLTTEVLHALAERCAGMEACEEPERLPQLNFRSLVRVPASLLPA